MREWKTSAIVAVAVLAVAGTAIAGSVARPSGSARSAAPSKCALAAPSNPIQHVIYLQFDNTHFARDDKAQNVASDLEQMPHLLDFLQKNGTLFTNDHTILISHTAGGILSSLTGLYPDRQGQTVSNSYDYFPASKVPSFTSSFKYWTDPVASNNPLPNMITDGQKNTPAPWVPFTRAGCDVGGVGTANVELENTADITQVFHPGSPEVAENAANSQLGQTDFVGIAIHCSQADSGPSGMCSSDNNGKPDVLGDEPGGYHDFNALYGTKYVDPAITGGDACVNDTSGQAITDPVGNCGFPGFDGMLAKNTLGYVAQMQENGVPVTYGYISDAHDLHVPTLTTDSYASSATGPGELAHQQQLKAYDDAFESFFDNLQQHGINKTNTLFVVTVDEGDHFAGGVGRPQQGQSWLVYDHRTCTNMTACPANQIGEVNVNINPSDAASNPGVLPPGQSPFDIHFDDAPTFYVNGQPGPLDAGVRKLEHDVGSLMLPDPYVNNGQSVPATEALADPVEEKALHMVNTDPSRTPTFTMFANPDFFFTRSDPCTGVHECVVPGFAWNHGDKQDEIGNTWVGFVGPGIASNGVDKTTWTDHTNLRPTILALLGLKDDYTDDGRVLVEALTKQAIPNALTGSNVQKLGDVYEQLNASFGSFAMDTLKASTKAIKSDDATYSSVASSISSLTDDRDTLATTIKNALNKAAFDNQPITNAQATTWITAANQLLTQAAGLPH
jgi:hypothetical protein